jgi:hypothetical protein
MFTQTWAGEAGVVTHIAAAIAGNASNFKERIRVSSLSEYLEEWSKRGSCSQSRGGQKRDAQYGCL